MNDNTKPSAQKIMQEELMYELQEFFHCPLYGDDPEEDIEKMCNIIDSHFTNYQMNNLTDKQAHTS